MRVADLPSGRVALEVAQGLVVVRDAPGVWPDEPTIPYWIACEHPERPPDPAMGYHLGYLVSPHTPCRACSIACAANVAIGTTDARILNLVAHDGPA